MSARAGRRGGGAEPRVVGGLHPVRELLRAGVRVDRLLVADSRGSSPVLDELLEAGRDAGVDPEPIERTRLDEATEGLVHQGVVALAPPYAYPSLRAVVEGIAGTALLVALDGVTDPHNLGSIARSAEAFGAHALIVPARRSAGVSPAAEKAAAGALAHLPVVRVPNLVRGLGDLSDHGIWSVGLDGDAPIGLGACALLDEPVVLVVGAEGRGLARLTAERCDQLVRLPMRGQVGSLNASVAAGIALHEAARRR